MIFSSLDIDFIYGDTHGRLFTNACCLPPGEGKSDYSNWSTDIYIRLMISIYIQVVCNADAEVWHFMPCHEWRHIMVTKFWVNIGSDNGLLPDGTKSLPEPVMTSH